MPTSFRFINIYSYFLDIIAGLQHKQDPTMSASNSNQMIREPKTMHLNVIQTLIENEMFMGKDPAMLQEVNQLQGYQYLTNNLLLDINESMSSGLQQLSKRFDKLEKAIGISWGEINTEAYWWFDRMSSVETVLRENEKILQIRVCF